MWPFGWNKYPYTDFHELNLDWILEKIGKLEFTMKNFIVDTKKIIVDTVNQWLDDHPEATTTVQDGSLTIEKFVSGALEYVTPSMYGAVGDGITDDYSALKKMFDTGLPVLMPDQTFCTSEELIYDGYNIKSSGTIKSINALERVLRCTSDNINIDGLKIDCNNLSAIGIYCIGTNICNIQNCEIKNTENATIGRLACAGIYTTGYYETYISNNRIENINRTNIDSGVISSCGINCTSDGNVTVINNYINGVKCSTQTTDCDGIYVSSNVALSCMALIENNIILDCTGRFIKTQTYSADIIGNRCRLINSDSNLYVKGIDYQRGGGCLKNNYIDYGNKADASSVFIHSDYNTNYDRNIEISGNVFVCTNEINSVFMIDGTMGGIIDIHSNNVFTSYINYVIRAGETTHYTKIKCENNDIPYYRFWNTNGETDYENVDLTVINNRSQYTGNQMFDRPVNMNNIIIHNNIGIVEKLTNVTMDFSKMKAFHLEYNQVGVAITNYPAALGTPDHVYLSSLSNSIFEYYDFSTGTRGISTI